MKLQNVKKLMIFLSVLFTLALILFLVGQSDTVKVVALIILASSALLFFVVRLFWKCPSCKSLLPTRDGMIGLEYCPFCGMGIHN